ncbi:MAG: HNH endonuclease [Deltaproteobacteria bacterium]|nr:HNH endonuclease [Deltaproteobacteria bacterium]
MRQQVRRRAGGRCEYCLIHEDDSYVSYQVDRILARKHGGVTEPSNLAYACVLCNRYKGSDIAAPDPLSGAVVPLFHPRQQRWQEHFTLQGVKIVPLSSTGRATATLLRLNAPERVLEREELLRARRYELP